MNDQIVRDTVYPKLMVGGGGFKGWKNERKMKGRCNNPSKKIRSSGNAISNCFEAHRVEWARSLALSLSLSIYLSLSLYSQTSWAKAQHRNSLFKENCNKFYI